MITKMNIKKGITYNNKTLKKHIRKNILCNYTKENKSIFQITDSASFSSLQDIEELLQTSSNMSYKDKKDLFCSFGLDIDKVEKYYDVVSSLNFTYYISNKNNMHNIFENAVPKELKPFFVVVCFIYNFINEDLFNIKK